MDDKIIELLYIKNDDIETFHNERNHKGLTFHFI